MTSAFGTVDVSGMDGDGKITATIGGLAGLFALIGLTKGSRRETKAAVVLAGIGVVVAAVEWNHVSGRISSIGNAGGLARVSVGMGIWVMLAGFVVAVVCLAVASSPSAG